MGTRWKIWGSTMLLAGALCSVPANAGVVSVFSDNFSNTQLGESQTGAIDSSFNVMTANVDVIGNIVNPPLSGVPSNLTSFESICASSGFANCVDLDGTAGNNPESGLQSIALTLSAGTYNFSYDLLGASGFESTTTSGRPTTTQTLVLFGSLSCITSLGTGCVYTNTVTLGATDTTDGNIAANGLTVSTGGTDYIAFVSETPGYIGSLLTSASLTETVVTPEPGTMLLLGSALLGLGGLSRLRARRNSR